MDKVIKILTVEISRVVYNIVNKIDTYTQWYQHIVNYLITLSTVLTCNLIITKNFPNYNIIRLYYPQINMAVDNLIHMVWIKCAYKKIYYLQAKSKSQFYKLNKKIKRQNLMD